MELIDMFRVVRRWLWLIVTIIVVAELALWLGMRSAESVYTTTVSLQISTPQNQTVEAYDQYRSISMRDEITVAINNFVELSQSDEVRQRVIKQLGLEAKDQLYTVDAARLRDADFLTVTVGARQPDLAAAIANAHVGVAIAYYGELRAQATRAEQQLFADQLRMAEAEFHAAEQAVVDFRTKNGIYSLEDQLASQEELLKQLQLERDQLLLRQVGTPVASTSGVAPTSNAVAEVDRLISQRQKELEQFTALTPQYNILLQNVQQAREAYQHLLSKNSEAELKVTEVEAANFIQVVKPAYAPPAPDYSWPKLAILAFVGSLGLGVVLAFVLEYLSNLRPAGAAASDSDQNPPSPGKRSGRKTRSTDAEQAPIPAQVPQGAGLAVVPVEAQIPQASPFEAAGADVQQEPIEVLVPQDVALQAVSADPEEKPVDAPVPVASAFEAAAVAAAERDHSGPLRERRSKRNRHKASSLRTASSGQIRAVEADPTDAPGYPASTQNPVA